MRPESMALGQALLDHRQSRVSRHPPARIINRSLYTIRYGILCERVNLSGMRSIGTYLKEIQEWCRDNQLPPLTSLAVNDSGWPGEGYDGAGGFKLADWEKDVEKCIRFQNYPKTIHQT